MTLYFPSKYGPEGMAKYARGDCDATKLISNSDGEEELLLCGKKDVPGIEFDDSDGEYGPIFICVYCLNELLKTNPDYVPGYMVEEGT